MKNKIIQVMVIILLKSDFNLSLVDVGLWGKRLDIFIFLLFWGSIFDFDVFIFNGNAKYYAVESDLFHESSSLSSLPWSRGGLEMRFNKSFIDSMFLKITSKNADGFFWNEMFGLNWDFNSFVNNCSSIVFLTFE